METKIIELKINTNLDQTNNDVSKLKTNLDDASVGAKGFDKAISGKKGANFNELKDTIGGLIPGFDKASTGASLFNKQLLVLVANPIGAVVAAVVLAIVGLVAIFRTFQPVVDKVEQSVAALGAVMNTIKNTFLSVFNGTKSLGQAFSGLGTEMKTAARRTMELVKAQQDLDDVLASQEIQTARTTAEINKLNVQAKNRALTEEQRLKLLQRASSLEEQDFKQRRTNADELVRQAREAIAIKAGFNSKEIKLLKEQGLAAKELAESKGGNFDEEFKALAIAQKNRISLQDESTANLEKNQNKQDALFDKQEAKKEQAIANGKIRTEKNQAEEAKRLEKKAENDKLEQEKIRSFGEKARQEYEDAQKLIADAKKANDNILKTENELKVEAENIEYERKKGLLIAANLSTEELDKLHKQNLSNLELEYFSKQADAAILATAKEKQLSDARKKIAEEEFAFKIAQAREASVALGQLSELAGKDTLAGKALGIASATINTYVGVTEALKQKSVLPSPFDVVAKIANVATVLASGFKAVKAITAVKVPGGGGGGSPTPISIGSSSAAAAPSFNVVGTSGQNQIAQSLGNQAPIKAYVVANDVSTQQGLDRNIVKTATIG